jgi:hypothetical protein
VADGWPVATAGITGHPVIAGTTRRLSALTLPALAGSGIGRRAAERLARRELARSMYAESIQERFLHWLENLVGRIFSGASSFPGGFWTVVGLLLALVAITFVIPYVIRPGGFGRAGAGAVLTGSGLSASELRMQAEHLALAGDFTAALIEQVRAIAAEIEERGILPVRPGRTANELAAQAGRAMPDLASELTTVALLFDDVLYGGRDGTALGYERARDLDARIRSAKAAASSAGPEPAPWAVVS